MKIGPFELNDIYCIDAFEGMEQLPLGSIDLLITDPPYEGSLDAYESLAKQAPRILGRGASLIMIVGHYAISDVIKMFARKLKFRWIICMNQFEGNHVRLSMGIEVMWKPILWYVNGVYHKCRKGYIRDGIVSSSGHGINKESHHWEQNLDWLFYYIERICPASGIVLDPFIGSGGVAVVSNKLGRNFIGFDINPKYVEVARDRVKYEGKWEPDFF